MSEAHTVVTMPAMALRGLTIFPTMMLHFDVGREASIKALDECMSSGRPIFLVTQRDLSVENPQLEDVYTIGTISQVRQILRLPGDNVRVMVEGVSRGRASGPVPDSALPPGRGGGDRGNGSGPQHSPYRGADPPDL